MQFDLKGTRAVVSGSTEGIGYAIARGLAVGGAEVVVNGRSEARTEEAAARLRFEVAGAVVAGVAGDLSTAEGAGAFLARAGAADILVNNVGIFEPKPFADIPDEDWERLFQTNVMSGVRLSRHYLPRMLEKGWGRIVFISSESAVNVPPEMIHYGMTKTAQLSIARGLAEMTAGTGVTVNSVLPGPTRSAGVATFLRRMAEKEGYSPEDAEASFIRQNRPTSLLRRLATVEEVANMVLYACSREASATNGAALRVEGGLLRSIV